MSSPSIVLGLDEENAKVEVIDSSNKPLHTRLARFGTVFFSTHGEAFEVDAKDILCGFIEELDRRNQVLTDVVDKAQFLMEMYVTNILSLKVTSPSDLIQSNDVEDLTLNNELYKLMQQYTVYPIWDLYKLSLNDWLDQPPKDMEFQLKMARAFKKQTEVKNNNPLDEDNLENVAVDEAQIVAQIEQAKPTFKRNF